ncbi:DUF7144 family membrane protein [Streptomyces sp. NRRL S-337]|uniref:DUF7144 family membrane protein n=1 Tax=Streptomyces sp. NRRL S-337 TaxID=1463900 RepID=UPI00068B26ED|nr:hypothetical protein [Streptomyces sp. NRRL S-337]
MESSQPPPETRRVPPAERSHWVAFAGILLMLSGLFDLINGFVALLDKGYYSTTANHGNRLLIFDFAVWGWVWIVTGVAQVLASLGVFLGARAARITGIVLASACLVGQLIFLSAFPYWSIFVMAMSLLVIYGLVTVPRRLPGERV